MYLELAHRVLKRTHILKTLKFVDYKLY